MWYLLACTHTMYPQAVGMKLAMIIRHKVSIYLFARAHVHRYMRARTLPLPQQMCLWLVLDQSISSLSDDATTSAMPLHATPFVTSIVI